MSRTIAILPKELANKIAAGEVVQRPSSVVKELVENSVDASARSITVVAEGGGLSLVHVSDDGSGMTAEDARIACERHATSKIATVADLEAIRTLGFRGEALAAISAVSHLELRTRHASEELGTRIRIEGGAPPSGTKEALPVGTSVHVRNLFYNTPARRAFMKSEAAEFRHVCETVQSLAMAHPGIAFRLVSAGETLLNLRPADEAARVAGVCGEKVFRTLFPFREEGEGIAVSGFLGRPEFGRKARSEQHIYLNRRPVFNRSVRHAVVSAYENLLEQGSFPLFVLFLEVDPRKVDVNVHPAKAEVKFADDRWVHSFVASAVRKALSRQDLSPSLLAGRPEGHPAELRLVRGPSGGPGEPAGWETAGVIPHGDISPYGMPEPGELPMVAEGAPGEAAPEGGGEATAAFPSAALLWQVHNKYIVAPTGGGILIVDQHAAHERILYERVIAGFGGDGRRSQQLLFPQTVEVTPGDAALVSQLQPLLEGLGFSIKMFGRTTVIVEGVPADVRPGREGNILRDVLDRFKEDEELSLEPRERLAKTFACKAAVKAGDPLSRQEMEALLEDLTAANVPAVCPHGRPTMIRLSLSELDKRFGRTPQRPSS